MQAKLMYAAKYRKGNYQVAVVEVVEINEHKNKASVIVVSSDDYFPAKTKLTVSKDRLILL